MKGILLGFWVLFLAVLFVQRRLAQESVAGRAPGTWLGIAVQAVGFSAIWSVRGVPVAASAPAALAWTSNVLGAVSVALALAAIVTLGRQWSVAARVLDQHELITRGPYAWVRHPIYTALGGMLVATALAVGSWTGLAAGLGLYLLGTLIRIHYEERLLRARFGDAYVQYAARVPAFLPWPMR